MTSQSGVGREGGLERVVLGRIGGGYIQNALLDILKGLIKIFLK